MSSFQDGLPATKWQQANDGETASIESELHLRSGSAEKLDTKSTSGLKHFEGKNGFVNEIPSIPVTSATKFDLIFNTTITENNLQREHFFEGQQHILLQK